MALGKATEDQPDNRSDLFPVVGIGASAGGLEAFTDLLRHLPTDTGMAFVLIQHMAPDRRSLLTEILSRVSQMPVTEVQDGMAVESNHVYVIPPNTEMTLVQGVLQLTPREQTQRKFHPVNTFFRSLAADRGSRAIAVVLSGTDGDGALGLEAIKLASGITFAQCEATAEFNGMPNTAVATGHVDFVLPPQEIAEELAKISRHPYVTSPIPAPSVKEHLKAPPHKRLRVPQVTRRHSPPSWCCYGRPPGLTLPSTSRRPCCGELSGGWCYTNWKGWRITSSISRSTPQRCKRCTRIF